VWLLRNVGGYPFKFDWLSKRFGEEVVGGGEFGIRIGREGCGLIRVWFII
jgi:hypothetical protein